jgi:uncharacterized spore protein YtfJ
MMYMAAEENIKATIDELQKVLSANNIIGQPIEMEDKIIVPITKMGMGFGTGSSQCGDNKKAGGTSGGAGGGVGVFPVAVVIVSKGVAGHEGVKVVPLGTPNALSESLGEIASVLMERFSRKKESSEEKHDSPPAASVEVK